MWPDGSYYDVICSRSDYMSYDNNGNMTKKDHYSNMEPNENHTYTYDILNRLEKHTLQGGAVTTYHYGSDGLRDKKTTGGDTIKYYCDENGIVLNEANANGSHRATNVVGADGTIIARKNQSGDIGKFIKNEHGDVTNVISENASNTYKYEPWGTITAKTGTFDNPIRYSGEYYDDESGLIYLRNRYYDPSLRRFISVDPAKDGLNWYAYCGNNPVNYWDPTGLAIRIENNNSRVFDLLKKLTDDSITLNKDTGNVLIDNKVNIEQTPHRNGTMLVRRIIENENTILIKVDNNRKNEFLPFDMTITINLRDMVMLTTYDERGKKRSYRTPAPDFIKLAHEMAHADHFLRGTLDYATKEDKNQYYNHKGELVTERVRTEELFLLNYWR